METEWAETRRIAEGLCEGVHQDSGSQSWRIGKATSGREDKRGSTCLKVVPIKKSKILKCFLCCGTHKVRECPQTAALTALQAQVQEEQGVGSKRHCEVPKGGQELGIGLEAVVPMEPEDEGW